MKFSNSYVRVIFLTPNSPSLDIYINGDLISSHINYGKFTEYATIRSGISRIKIYVSGTLKAPIISKLMYLRKNKSYTFIICNRLEYIKLLIRTD